MPNFKMRNWLAGRWVGIGVILLAIAGGASYWYQVNEQHEAAAEQARYAAEQARYVECQTKFNEAFAQQLIIRSNLLQAADDTRDELLLGLSKIATAKPSMDPEVQAKRRADLVKLFVKYPEATKEVSDARKSTPLPALPDC